MKRVLVALLFAGSVSAAPVITGLSPASAPAAGGTVVTIKGSGFEGCPVCSPTVPPQVYFGAMKADVITVEPGGMQVTLPPNLPGTVDVRIEQWNGITGAQGAFTYTGTIDEAFRRILLPIYLPPIKGVNNASFITELRVASSTNIKSTYVFGLKDDPFQVGPGWSYNPSQFKYSGNPGRFVYVPRSQPEFYANLRVFDVSRAAFNFGTEIPLVHDTEFVRGPLKLVGVPLDGRYRLTLRIYAVDAVPVTVSAGAAPQTLMLTPGRNEFEPAYGAFTDFPVAFDPIDITITAINAAPIWAFVTVTNNDTQLITTITPQH